MAKQKTDRSWFTAPARISVEGKMKEIKKKIKEMSQEEFNQQRDELKAFKNVRK